MVSASFAYTKKLFLKISHPKKAVANPLEIFWNSFKEDSSNNRTTNFTPFFLKIVTCFASFAQSFLSRRMAGLVELNSLHFF